MYITISKVPPSKEFFVIYYMRSNKLFGVLLFPIKDKSCFYLKGTG